MRPGIAVKLFNKDGYSLGTYLNGDEVNDMEGVQPMGLIGPDEKYPVLDISPSTFQIGSWDEDLRRFAADQGANQKNDLAELDRLALLAQRASKK